ncbi:MAG TPA: glycerol-3-phosphate dehydrogenase [Gammaproteobacteria bacterium]
MGDPERLYDVAVIGGGINGAGIACDAAGRGLSVLLLEAGDLGGGTSSASTKLIHGGLRYLEYMEFRLVREALKEREILLAKAPHLVWPMRFVVPHCAAMRPWPLVRLGLFLYDHLAPRHRIPGSSGIDLATDPAGAPLRDEYRRGFTYWDCWADDARLVVLNARAAAQAGASVRTRTRCLSARREDGRWSVAWRDESSGATGVATARALVNAAGPWVGQVANRTETGHGRPPGTSVRLVKGSHIVVPRIPGTEGAESAYLLQNDDRRVVFILPFEHDLSLVGTTDVPFAGDASECRIDADEIDYLLEATGRYLKRPLNRDEVLWSFSGVRPLFDDEATAAQAVTRDYRLQLDGADGAAPLLTVLGGKLTTYRRLAEEALERLAPCLQFPAGPWTANATLPGGDIPRGDSAAWVAELQRRRSGFARDFLARLAARHGTLVDQVLGDARDLGDLGEHVGGDLYEREVRHFAEHEWAREPDDVLWRRTKTGVHLPPERRAQAAETIARML